MKHTYAFLQLAFALSAAPVAHGQWCEPTTLVAYASTMPGITRFQLNTIDRTSADLESMSNNYVNTGLSTTLVKGQSYAVTIDFTIDAPICPDMNLRIWVDLNHDGQLDDAGETLLTVNHDLPPTYAGTITIPMSAQVGDTRLRVTAKMSDLGGHILPTPCDMPQDPFGYHGAMEDYTVSIVSAVGIEELAPVLSSGKVLQDASGGGIVQFDLGSASNVVMRVVDGAGRLCTEQPLGGLGKGTHRVPLSDELRAGFYVAQLITEEQVLTLPFVQGR